MGKALLLMVLGTGLFVSVGYMSTQEALVETVNQQASHEEEVLAREIARSGFNVGMGIARPYGANLIDAVAAVNGSQGVMRGDHQGGEYRVRARALEGFTLEISSTGYYGGEWVDGEYVGGATNTMRDVYTIPVLMARQCSVLRARYLESMAGYCSAVFMETYPLGAVTPPVPEMIFPAGHNGDNVSLSAEKFLAPGTQMNFFIGVDQDCSSRPGGPRGDVSIVRNYDVLSHVFNQADYNHIHRSLDLEVERLGDMSESIWGMVEQHPTNNQRWRMGWEDQHITRWDNPNSTDPSQSLQALKIYGYDGNGWLQRNSSGYRQLRDYGSRPDYSDQVIEVWLEPVRPEDAHGACDDVRVLNPPDDDPTPGGGDDDGGSGSLVSICHVEGGTHTTMQVTLAEVASHLLHGDSNGSCSTGGGSGTEPPPPPPLPPCGCPRGNNNKKVSVMHFPPGNNSNPQQICIAREGWENGHDRHNGDYIICEGN